VIITKAKSAKTHIPMFKFDAAQIFAMEKLMGSKQARQGLFLGFFSGGGGAV